MAGVGDDVPASDPLAGLLELSVVPCRTGVSSSRAGLRSTDERSDEQPDDSDDASDTSEMSRDDFSRSTTASDGPACWQEAIENAR